MLVEKEFLADLIPVDVVINAMIVAAWKTAQDYTGNPTIPPVYNVTSGSIKPINWGKYCSMSIFSARLAASLTSLYYRSNRGSGKVIDLQISNVNYAVVRYFLQFIIMFL
jgi:hypothetical protein